MRSPTSLGASRSPRPTAFSASAPTARRSIQPAAWSAARNSPAIFQKPAETLVPHKAPLRTPAASRQFDYEGNWPSSSAAAEPIFRPARPSPTSRAILA
ncbi:fumarylacetoacetate hydrolase family protein [Belnapia sp. T18]|uniref:Fumarylacetoacetate hydrolase family protein n=1 Tax=Belnapia arida TaxID=2804533 RepID=A0ABS1U095_9PROT|nr:fumarylacetoacetate hydrolase family protein [Belnapia arida]